MCRVKRFRHSQQPDDDKIIFWCPGCEAPHWVRLSGASEEIWGWNGDFEYPTIYPSLVVAPFTTRECHLTIVFGMIHFGEECWHALRGRTVVMPPWEGYDPDKWREQNAELYL